jgi:hypothetical protein
MIVMGLVGIVFLDRIVSHQTSFEVRTSIIVRHSSPLRGGMRGRIGHAPHRNLEAFLRGSNERWIIDEV